MNTHTPEPWVAVRNTAYWEIGTEIDGYYAPRIGDVCATDPNHPDAGKQEANATRIVACVNACKGINPEAVPDLLEVARFFADCLRTRREGLKRDVPAFRARWNVPIELTVEEFSTELVRAALAKVEGGAA